MNAKHYRVDPDFVVPEPSAARHFAMISEAEYAAGEHEHIINDWREAGVQQIRLTLVNDEFPHEPYPPGIWLEGWTDKNARQLPFGGEEDGVCWPPLTYATEAPQP